VAHHIAAAENNFKSAFSTDYVEEAFFQMMRNLEFMPNSPTLMNAGTSIGQLSACFVLPVEDSITGIFESLGHMAKIHQTGGGTGFNFSKLRPKYDIVSSTKGHASGPVSFMSIFDKATGIIVQGGRRRGANMGILRCDHPDIIEFIEAKIVPDRFTNFNLSVGVTDNFLRAVRDNRTFNLINPRTAKVARQLKARDLFDLMATAAWQTGDPGLVFLDEINRHNPTPRLGQIEATNPCGELPLMPFESCTLASINLAKMVKTDSPKTSKAHAKVDWDKLGQVVHWAVRFLDDVLEVNVYPLEQVKSATLANRKIGLGVMGFADMLIKMALPYNSPQATAFAAKLMRFIHTRSLAASAALAKQRGVFPNFSKSIYAKKNLRLRNATVNTIAPAGTISIIAGCSSGIEPLFAVSFVRNVLSGNRLFEVSPLFRDIMEKRHIDTAQVLAEIAQQGSVQKINGIPNDIKRIFVTAFDIKPIDHLNMQSAFQKYTDNAVSKTINLPSDAAVGDVKNIFLMAHKLRCKGITVYRYGSRDQQVLSFGYSDSVPFAIACQLVTAGAEYSGGCAAGTCLF
jgi:ribonucleoside-diphosphate reductase alpha chain